MASGDVVNTAARLQAAAPVDGILVDEATWRATGRRIDYQQAEPVSAKGKAEPVPAWLALAPRASLGVEVVQAPTSALVGRGRELEVLTGALARVRSEQAPQLVTLVGVPGDGQEPARLGTAADRRGRGGRDRLAPGPVPALRGGGGPVGPGGGGQGPGRHPGLRLGRGGRGQAGPGGRRPAPRRGRGGLGDRLAGATGRRGRGRRARRGEPGGGVRGLATVPGGTGRGEPGRAGGRGPALGRRAAAGLPGPSGRLGGRGPAPGGGDRPARAAGPPAGVGGRQAQQHHGVADPPQRGGHGPAGRRAARPGAAAGRGPDGAADQGRWEPAVRRGVRAHAGRPRVPRQDQGGAGGWSGRASCRCPRPSRGSSPPAWTPSVRKRRSCSRPRPCSARSAGWAPWPP